MKNLFRLVALVVLWPAMAAAECTDVAPRMLFIAVDTSASITVEQRQRWLPLAQQLVGALCGGDHLRIYRIDNHTLDAAALFPDPDSATSGAMPKLDGATLSKRWRYAVA